jgi:hypothetical protein
MTQSHAETSGMARRVQDASVQSGNKPARAAWFQDLALGMFIHWSVDVQLGSVISHSLASTFRPTTSGYCSGKDTTSAGSAPRPARSTTRS